MAIHDLCATQSPPQDSCKVGHRGLERQAVLFEKLLLLVKRKDVKKYTYKAHIVVSSIHLCGQSGTRD